ncbi:MAG: hypothetical protein WDO24_27490 [Pseudomonadota bacterium]
MTGIAGVPAFSTAQAIIEALKALGRAPACRRDALYGRGERA